MLKKILLVHVILSYLIGYLLTYSFAPYSMWFLAILLPCPLLYIWSTSSVKLAALSGMMFGMGFFAHGVSWILNSIHECGDTPFVFAIIMSICFWSTLSLFSVLTSIATAKANQNQTHPKLAQVVVFASSWAMLEVIRGWLLTGFPWLLLGNSHIDSPLRHFAPVVGVYGITFISLMISGFIYIILSAEKEQKTYKHAVTLTMFTAILTFIFYEYNWTVPSSGAIKISLVQANISPTDKYASKTPLHDTWLAYGEETIKNIDSDIIVWPEHSVPVPFPESKQFIDSVDTLAKKFNTTIITGFPYKIPDDSKHYYNALAALGNNNGLYFKKHLVPYGEYIPFVEKIEKLSGELKLPEPQFRPGPDSPLLKINNHEILPLICYEIAHPEYVRMKVNSSNPQFVININEDGYFDKFKGPHQNLEIARMRALENGRYTLRSSSTGISAIIDDKGYLLGSSPLYQAFTVQGEIYPHIGRTPFTIFGVWGVFTLLGGLLILATLIINKSKIQDKFRELSIKL